MQQVHTDPFYILEGFKEDGAYAILAWSLEPRHLVAFMLGLEDSNREGFVAFRVMSAGGVLKPANLPAPTHSAPASPV